MVSTTDIDTFAAHHQAGAPVIDVREPHEYEAGHVPGARLIPLGEVAGARDVAPQGTTVYVICASGNRSKTACTTLATLGVDAVSIDGGTSAWKSSGRPVVTGPHAS